MSDKVRNHNKNDFYHTHTHAYAKALDDEDPLKGLRSEFIIPSKDDLKRKTSRNPGMSNLSTFNLHE